MADHKVGFHRNNGGEEESEESSDELTSHKLSDIELEPLLRPPTTVFYSTNPSVDSTFSFANETPSHSVDITSPIELSSTFNDARIPLIAEDSTENSLFSNEHSYYQLNSTTSAMEEEKEKERRHTEGSTFVRSAINRTSPPGTIFISKSRAASHNNLIGIAPGYNPEPVAYKRSSFELEKPPKVRDSFYNPTSPSLSSYITSNILCGNVASYISHNITALDISVIPSIQDPSKVS